MHACIPWNGIACRQVTLLKALVLPICVYLLHFHFMFLSKFHQLICCWCVRRSCVVRRMTTKKTPCWKPDRNPSLSEPRHPTKKWSLAMDYWIPNIEQTTQVYSKARCAEALVPFRFVFFVQFQSDCAPNSSRTVCIVSRLAQTFNRIT